MIEWDRDGAGRGTFMIPTRFSDTNPYQQSCSVGSNYNRKPVSQEISDARK